jgi:hypothetical protein
MYIGIQTDYKSAFAVGLGRGKKYASNDLLGLID